MNSSKKKVSQEKLTSDQEAQIDQTICRFRTKSTKPIAFFLGAGSSKTFGYPLTRDLMLEIFQGLASGNILDKPSKKSKAVSRRPRKDLHEFLHHLLPGKRVSKKNVPLVTGVLSLLDFSLATGQALLPGRSLDDTRVARQLLEQALLEIIPDYLGFSGKEEQLFNKFCSLLKGCMSHRPPGGLGLITTNYDMVTDLAAMEIANVKGDDDSWSLPDLASKVDFGFRWVSPDDGANGDEETYPRPTAPLVSLFKLHGSTNWLRCPLCENLYINPLGPIAWIAAEKTNNSSSQCHCSETRLEAQIVSPSFVREMREPNLIAIWKSALELLREADHWAIVGYSFPDEDVGIRALFTRAFGSKKKHPVITVIQHGDGARVNYESFFPSGTISYLNCGLEPLLTRWSRTQNF